MTPEEQNCLIFKIVIIGNSDVGKSSLLLRFVENSFTEQYISTIGVDFRQKSMSHNDTKLKLQIWDTAGQERYRTITQAYYRGANAVLFMYNMNSSDDIQDGFSWHNEIKDKARKNTIILPVGSKSDLENLVPKEEQTKLEQLFKCDSFIVSSKTGEGVKELFDYLVVRLLETYDIQNEEIKTKHESEKRTLLTKIKNDDCLRKCCS